MDLKRLIVTIGADMTGLKKGLQEAQKDLRGAFGRDTIQASKDLGVAVAAVAAGFVFFAGKAVMANETLKQETRNFEALTGSAEKAKNLLSELEDIGTTSAFSDETLRKYTKQLLIMGFTADQAVPTIKAISEAAAATGAGEAGLGAIAEALSIVKERGILTTRSMNTLISAGLPAWDILAAKIGTTVPEAQERLKKGTIDSGTALAALINGMNDKYKGSMGKMKDDITVSWVHIIDGLEKTTRTFGAKITAALGLEKLFSNMATAVQKFSETFKSAGIGAAMDELIDPKIQAGIIAIAGAITVALLPGLWSTVLAIGAIDATMAPWIALGAAIAALAFVIIKNWEPISRFFEKLWINIKYYTMVALYAVADAFIFLAKVAVTAAEKIYGWIPGLGDKLKEAKKGLDTFTDNIEKAKTNNFKTMTDDMGKLNKSIEDGTKKIITHKKELPTTEDYKPTAAGIDIIGEATTKLEAGTKTLGASFSDTFADIVMGTKTVTDALKDLGGQMAKLFIKTGFEAILSAITGTSSGAAATGGLPAFAEGGYTGTGTGATLAILHPREYIVPEIKAAGFAQSLSGGKISIQNTIINNAGGQVEAATTTRQDGEKIILNTIISAIATNKSGLKTYIKGAAK